MGKPNPEHRLIYGLMALSRKLSKVYDPKHSVVNYLKHK